MFVPPVPSNHRSPQYKGKDWSRSQECGSFPDQLCTEELMLLPGQQLRMLREQLGLTMRDVEVATARIAGKHGNEDYTISLSRLSDIETKGIVPSIYRLYSLSVIYRRDIREILSWYGVDVNDAAGDMSLSEPRRSHRAE